MENWASKMESMEINNIMSIYKGKKIFLTGHTGFKGAWLSVALNNLGGIIKGYSLEPEDTLSLYNLIKSDFSHESIIADINDSDRLKKELIDFQPDFIFHLAAQPLVRKSYREPLVTFNTNVIGTANLLNAALSLEKKCTIVTITTDKVYENREIDYAYKESDRLGGYDPYSASKACAELVINSYRQSFFNINNIDYHKKGLVSVRAGNVIGGGDWSEDRLIPDIVKSIELNNKIEIRNPFSVRPWQHVLEPVFGYLKLGALLSENPIRYTGSWNFGPTLKDNLPVIEIVQQAIKVMGKGNYEVIKNLEQPHEAGLLKLNTDKALNEMCWKPLIDTHLAIEFTMNWYKLFYQKKKSAFNLIQEDIRYFQSLK
jgi:CDP-glucose 4,6-dehydratase